MPHYTYTVLHNDKPVARAEADRIDVAMREGKEAIPSGYLLSELDYLMIDPYGMPISGPLVAPVRFN